LASADLDKLRRAIIDLAADHPDLDSGTLKNQLSAKGFDQAVATVLAHTVGLRFAATGADQSEAAAGLAHIVALRGEREARREAELAERRLAEEMTGEALASFEAKRQVIEDGESRRRDIDGGEVATNRIRR